MFGSISLGLTLMALPNASVDSIHVWTCDPLVKLLKTSYEEHGHADRAEAARGEMATWQLGLRASKPATGVKVFVEPLTRRGGKEVLEGVRTRFVGYVNVPRLADTPAKDVVGQPPLDVPDPLLEDPKTELKPDETQAAWIDIPIPLNAVPGLYQGFAKVIGNVEGRDVTIRVAISVKVFEAKVGESRLWVTNWFNSGDKRCDAEGWSEAEAQERRLRMYARSMAAHRQNVVLTPILGLVDFGVGPDGKLNFNFDRFDDWVRWFREEGALKRIEGGHFGGRVGVWTSAFVYQVREVKDGKVAARTAPPDDPGLQAFYAAFLPQLVAHLKQKNLLGIYTQHLADEPIAENRQSYIDMAQAVKRAAPELKIVEACHDHQLTGSIDVWCPQLNFFDTGYAHYTERQKAGDEVWFYTCVFPQGEYPNRFIEQPLIKARLLHWQNFRFGATGYLHWGWNHWPEDPFNKVMGVIPESGLVLPAGDSFIVYPGKGSVLDSIRYEAMRDGIADHELLSLVADKNPELARKVADRMVPALGRVETDIATFREARRELLVALGELQKQP